MKHVSGFAAIALASSLALLATGCKPTPEDQALNDASQATNGEKTDNAVGSAKQDARNLGDTLKQKADQAGRAIDDAAITTAIKSKYLADDTLKGLDISVETKQGVVTLTGAVRSDDAKALAAKIAEGVDGVASVNNQLAVRRAG